MILRASPRNVLRAAIAISLSCGSACAPSPQAKRDPATERIAEAPATPAPDQPENPPPSAAAPTAPTGAKVRAIHPTGDSKDCIEMYGSCTPPPDRLCTSSAFVLSCGESGQLPSGKHEWLRCVCP